MRLSETLLKKIVISMSQTIVSKRTSSLKKSLIKSLSQTDDNCQEAKSQSIEKMLQRMAVLRLILHVGIKEGDTRRVTWNSLVVD